VGALAIPWLRPALPLIVRLTHAKSLGAYPAHAAPPPHHAPAHSSRHDCHPYFSCPSVEPPASTKNSCAPSPTTMFSDGAPVLRVATHASPLGAELPGRTENLPAPCPRLHSPIWKHRLSRSTIGSSPVTREFAIGDRRDLAIRDRCRFDNVERTIQITPTSAHDKCASHPSPPIYTTIVLMPLCVFRPRI
jgi:hypothetical protein